MFRVLEMYNFDPKVGLTVMRSAKILPHSLLNNKIALFIRVHYNLQRKEYIINVTRKFVHTERSLFENQM